MKVREIISLLERNSFVIIRANKHWLYRKDNITVCVPRHKEVNKFLAKKILMQAGIV